MWLFRYFRVSPRIFLAACRFDQFDLLAVELHARSLRPLIGRNLYTLGPCLWRPHAPATSDCLDLFMKHPLFHSGDLIFLFLIINRSVDFRPRVCLICVFGFHSLSRRTWFSSAMFAPIVHLSICLSI